MASVSRSLSDAVQIGSIQTKNRICIPPMVLYGNDVRNGNVTERHVAHYTRLAKGGAGLIIQEATCVLPEGRLAGDQLGIWADEQIEGLKRIPDAVHAEGCPVFLQIHHAGIMSVGEEKLCPSSYVYHRAAKKFVRFSGEAEEVRGREMTLEEIKTVRDAFVSAAVRAEKAGYDGVELHGCHSYLLCEFLNHRVNTRTDDYADGMKLVLEIYEEIRKQTGPDFVVGIRLGGLEPDLQCAIAHAKTLAEHGIDFIDVSYGFTGEMDTDVPGNPHWKPIHRAAAAIRHATGVPTFAVDGIRTKEDAEMLILSGSIDMADVGRSALVDPEWPKKVLAGENAGMCLRCRDCQWRHDKNRCPGSLRLQRGL